MEHLAQARILVVDDNPQNLIAIESILKDLNLPISTASSARDALKLVLKYDFVVILLDVQLPDIDGFETARLIRSREKSSYTPIIFLSAWYKDEIDVDKGYAMGAVDYIFKPINPITLRYKVKVFIDLFTKSSLAISLQNELLKRLRAEQQTGRQKRQLELAHQERINTMEEMSSALAHELNQPLAAISNYVKGCIHRLNDGNYDLVQIVNILQRTTQQAERAGEILHRIKDFVRKNKLCLEPVQINELVTNIATLSLEETAETKIELNFNLTSQTIPPILLDKIQFEQVLINLLRNSIEVLRETHVENPQIKIENFLKNPQTLVIEVKDNGPGINVDAASKLFDLYFTTKATGMGVGLSICRTIVEAHGGNIMAYNNPEGGACFQITLPIATHE
jgi:two-component system sensor histidine kinase/response regulator